MTVVRLDPERAAQLRTVRLTYPEVGQTAGDLPSGYRTFRRSVTSPGSVDFETAVQDLFRWQVQLRAGLRVSASSEEVRPDSVVVLSLGIGPIALHAACRVVYVVTQARCRGFAYGTLPGHPECGEEAFLLQQHDDGTVTFTVTGFSRPATVLSKLAGPLGTVVQDAMTARYLRALAT